MRKENIKEQREVKNMIMESKNKEVYLVGFMQNHWEDISHIFSTDFSLAHFVTQNHTRNDSAIR